MLHTWLFRSLLASFSMTGIFAFQCGRGENTPWNSCRGRELILLPLSGTFKTWGKKHMLYYITVAAGEIWSFMVPFAVILSPWIPTASSSSTPIVSTSVSTLFISIALFIQKYKKQLKMHHNNERKYDQQRDRKKNKTKLNPPPLLLFLSICLSPCFSCRYLGMYINQLTI